MGINMILKALLVLTLTSFIYAQEEIDLDDLAWMMELEELELVEEDPEDIYFPDDSYVGLKCTRDRATVEFTLDADSFDLNKKNDLGMYYHKPYVNVEYLTISPSQKKGMVVYWFNYWKNVDSDMYTFNGEEYSEKGPYESGKFVVNDYSYVISFRDSRRMFFNREDLSFGFPAFHPLKKMGSCVILETDDFIDELESQYERFLELKERNQQIIDSKKAKRKF